MQRLQKALEPKASVHQERDLVTLKVRVQEVETLVGILPCADELQNDLRLGVKGIVKKASRKNDRKPQADLCVDDTQDLIYF